LIASLKGVLTLKSPEGIVVETGGVGFDVLVSLPTLYDLPAPGNRVELIIHTHVRDNQILLIGFLRPGEREAFRHLNTVTGIGPRLAMNILSGLPAEELLEAILREDTPRLQRVPGVGKKMSQRIVLELKDKIPPRDIILSARSVQQSHPKRIRLEVLSALMNLGYKRKEAESAIEETLRRGERVEEWTLESLLKAALQDLVKQ